jgi:DNA-binding response OmpR family regulator
MATSLAPAAVAFRAADDPSRIRRRQYPRLKETRSVLAQEELRIAVVDDSADMTEVMTTLLNANGYKARGAGDATTALGLIHHWLPHAVLLDIDMPGIDGVELARHIRANYGSTIMLVALSGFGASHPRVKTIATIVDHAMSKPCNFTALMATLDLLHAFRKRR